MNQLKISACDRSTQTGHTAHIILHCPTEHAAAVFQFDNVQQAQTFQQYRRLSGYRVAYVWLFNTVGHSEQGDTQ